MIQSLRLQHFRSYADDTFEFSTGVNIIVGPNASGKTNLLEAMLVSALGSSYRVRDNELVAFGEPWARVDAQVGDQQRTVKLVTEPQFIKTYELGGRIFRRISLERTLPVVLFEPNHLSLLAGAPDRRRDYLDLLLSQTVSGYGQIIRAYRRTLAQRNRLLKNGRTGQELFPWDVRLSQLGGQIVRAREALVTDINSHLGELYGDLSKSTTGVSVAYKSAAAPDQYESHMLHQLELRIHDDVLRGFTSFGPHREDLIVLFDGHPAADVASRGETRTLVLALKISEVRLIESRRDHKPILLLDDVFSELDGARRKALTMHLSDYQVFITTTDADVVLKNFASTSNIIPVTRQS